MTRLWKITQYSLVVAMLAAVPAFGDDPRCPVVSAGGSNTDDGSVLVVGQVLVGSASSVTDDAELGAVPCWFGGTCFGDINGDGVIDLGDLAQMLAHYGEPNGQTYEDGDLDADGDVDLADLAALLAVYGTSCT